MSAWIQREAPFSPSAPAWTTPTASALATPNGWPNASTSSPGLSARASPCSAAGRSVAGIVSAARSWRSSRSQSLPRTLRPSASSISASPPPTYPLVTTRPSRRQTTPAPPPRPPLRTCTVTRASSRARAASASCGLLPRGTVSAAGIGSLPHGHRDRLRRARADDLQLERRADRLTGHGGEHVAGGVHRAIANRKQDVPQHEPSPLRRTPGRHVDDDQPHPAGSVLSLQRGRTLHRLRAVPKPAAGDPASLEQLLGDPGHGAGGNREGGRAGEARRVEAKDPPVGPDQGTTGKAVVDGDVEPDEVIDRAALPGAPLAAHGAHHTEARGEAPPGAAERQDEMAGPGRVVRQPDRGGESPGAAVEAKHREVGGGIATGERGADGGAVVKRDGDVLVALHRVVRRDDDAIEPGDAGGGNPTPGVNGDHRAADGFGRPRQIVGEGGEHATLGGNAHGNLQARDSSRRPPPGSRTMRCPPRLGRRPFGRATGRPFG